MHLHFFFLSKHHDDPSVNHTQPCAQVPDVHCARPPHTSSTIVHEQSLTHFIFFLFFKATTRPKVSTTPNPMPKCQMHIVPVCHIATAQSHTNFHFVLITQLFVTTQRQCTVYNILFMPSCPCASCVPHSTSAQRTKFCSFSYPTQQQFKLQTTHIVARPSLHDQQPITNQIHS